MKKHTKDTFTLAEIYPGEDEVTCEFRCNIGLAVKKSYMTINKGKKPEKVKEIVNGQKMVTLQYPVDIDGFNFKDYVRDRWPKPNAK